MSRVSVGIDSDAIIEIANYYGINHQENKLEEELVELLHEIVKDKKDSGKIENIQEEIADVLLMIYQILYLKRIQIEDIEGIIEYKAKRQLKRMEEE